MFKKYLTHKVAIGLAFIVGFTVLSAYIIFGFPEQKMTSPIGDDAITVDVLAETTQIDTPLSSPNLSRVGIVLLGYGGAGHEGGFLTDAIQVVSLDFEKGLLFLISIPRDLWIKLPNGTEAKINAAVINSATNKKELVASGASVLKKVLTEITGIEIDYFIGVDFVGLQRAIGVNLKGIDVSVAETLDDPWYPIKGEELNTCNMSEEQIKEVHTKYSGFELERQFTCRYKHLLFKKGIVRMEGGDALEYVRSRHGSTDGDISRGRRQQEILTAIRNRLFTLEALEKLPTFFTDITKHTQSDITFEIVNYLLPALKKSRDFKLKTINLSTTNVLQNSSSKTGGAIIIPKLGMFNWVGIREFIKDETNLP